MYVYWLFSDNQIVGAYCRATMYINFILLRILYRLENYCIKKQYTYVYSE